MKNTCDKMWESGERFYPNLSALYFQKYMALSNRLVNPTNLYKYEEEYDKFKNNLNSIILRSGLNQIGFDNMYLSMTTGNIFDGTFASSNRWIFPTIVKHQYPMLDIHLHSVETTNIDATMSKHLKRFYEKYHYNEVRENGSLTKQLYYNSLIKDGTNKTFESFATNINEKMARKKISDLDELYLTLLFEENVDYGYNYLSNCLISDIIFSDILDERNEIEKNIITNLHQGAITRALTKTR